jgi:hypothetical protein
MTEVWIDECINPPATCNLGLPPATRIGISTDTRYSILDTLVFHFCTFTQEWSSVLHFCTSVLVN